MLKSKKTLILAVVCGATVYVIVRATVVYDPVFFKEKPEYISTLIQADLGGVTSQSTLGLMYYMRMIVDQIQGSDWHTCQKRALYWLRRAEANGHPHAAETIQLILDKQDDIYEKPNTAIRSGCG